MSAYTGGGAAGGDKVLPDNTLRLIVGDQRITGWQSIRVTRGVERFPSDFDISLTEKYPGMAKDIIVKHGDACVVTIGDDTVITGYVDRYGAGFSPGNHVVRISGRSKCCDLIDCSGIVAGMQISGASTLGLAQTLAGKFGIKVTSLSGDGPAIPQFNVTLGETSYEIIERIARYSALLVHDGTDGNLLLAKVGEVEMASGFTQGANVETAGVEFSMDDRFSVYIPAIMSVDTLSDQGSGNTPFPFVYDEAVPRYRPLIVISEQYQNGTSVAVLRAQWESARRYGRSQSVRLTCDNWRDVNGDLWRPNAFAQVDLPDLKIEKRRWVVSEVTFTRDAERGTVADLVLMPPDAFAPEPSILQLDDGQVARALHPAGGGAAATNPAREK